MLLLCLYNFRDSIALKSSVQSRYSRYNSPCLPVPHPADPLQCLFAAPRMRS
jgi:hypothetical protein